MKLNPDCVRDTLLFLEDQLAINCKNNTFEFITLNELTEQMAKSYNYSEEDIWYTVYNLRQIHFIDGKFSDSGNHKMIVCNIENITWNGHQFLETIRPNTIWEATKNKAKQIGGMSLSGLSMVSSAIIQGLAGNQDFIQSIVDKIR